MNKLSFLVILQFLQSRYNLVLDGPVANILSYFKRHLVKFNCHILMPQMFMLNSNIVISQHCHMFDLSLIFLSQCISKSLLVAL